MTADWTALAATSKHESVLRRFRCASPNAAWEVEAETWVRHDAIAWAAFPTEMDERVLLLFDDASALAGIAAHTLEDSIATGIDGTFLTRRLSAIAVSTNWQGCCDANGARVSDVFLDTALADIRLRPERVTFINAFVRERNIRSRLFLGRNGFAEYPSSGVPGLLRMTLQDDE